MPASKAGSSGSATSSRFANAFEISAAKSLRSETRLSATNGSVSPAFTSISKETVPSTSAAEVTPIVVFFLDFFFLASATCVGASEATSEAASAEDDIAEQRRKRANWRRS